MTTYYEEEDNLDFDFHHDGMISVCFNCVEKINHPTIPEKISFWLCKK